MNSIEEVRDYLIADEIQRIDAMMPDDLARELIAFRSEQIESWSDKEVLAYLQAKKHGITND